MIIEKLQLIGKLVNDALEIRYKEYDLTISQAELLLHFYNNESNQISAHSALLELNRDKRLMSLSLKSLEDKGYITRWPNSDDKRQKVIELTELALDICEYLLGIYEEVNTLVRLNLTEDQIAVIDNIDIEAIEKSL